MVSAYIGVVFECSCGFNGIPGRTIVWVLGYPWTSFLRSWGGLWEPILGLMGYPWTCSARSRCKRPLPLSSSPRFKWFWSQKGALEGAKIKLKSIKTRFKIRSTFLLDVWLVSGALFVDFGSVLGTLDLPKWMFRAGEVLFFRKSRLSYYIRFWIDF